jgi:hypothetical protein
MKKYGFEHLRFSRVAYRHRNSLLIIGCISILFFEYHITEKLTIYNVTIPNKLIGLSLYVASFWVTIQFIFCTIDDYIDWKKNFLIDKTVRNRSDLYDSSRTILLELHSFSKGHIYYDSDFPLLFANLKPESVGPEEIKKGFQHDIERLEEKIKLEIKSIENFQKWYKRYSWFTIFRFAILEFTLPLLFILYAIIICQILPILPK